MKSDIEKLVKYYVYEFLTNPGLHHTGGLGDKIEDWVERLHQTGKRQCLHYRTVQNPAVRSLVREKGNSHNMHLDVIAQTDKINEDLVGML